MNPTRRRWLLIAVLAVILLVAFVLRTFNVDWAEGQLPQPDERSTVAFYAPSIRWPTQPGTFLDPRKSTLNPFWDVESNNRRSYTYGHFPLYLLVISGHLTQKLAPVAEALGAPQKYVDMMRIAVGSPGYAWVGRLLMAIADTLTVLYLFLLGRRIYGVHAGLLAALLGTFTVLQIQLAHFFAVDPISTTFTVAALYYAIRLVDTRRWRYVVLTGFMAALAIASKFSALPILAAPVVAGGFIWWQQEREKRSGEDRSLTFPVRNSQAPGFALKGSSPKGWLLAGAALLIAFAIFALTSPFVFLDWKNFYEAVVKEQGAMVRGIADFPFTRQYRGTTAYLYFISQQVRWGMGWFLGLLGWGALLWVVIKDVVRVRRLPGDRVIQGEVIILSWILPYFLITGSFLAKFNRYMAPIVPLLAVLGAGMLWGLAGWLADRRRGDAGERPSATVGTLFPVQAAAGPPESLTREAATTDPDNLPAASPDLWEQPKPDLPALHSIPSLAASAPEPVDLSSVDLDLLEQPDASLAAELLGQTFEESAPPPVEPHDTDLTEPTAVAPDEQREAPAATLAGPPLPTIPPAASTPTRFLALSTLRPSRVRLFWVLALIVLIPTTLWALAFVNGVYNREHTFITASKWMYDNIPDGSVWITEHWEEGMPLVLPIPRGNPGEHGWQNVSMPMYEEDTPEKFEILKQNMQQGDYYVLATKRLYGALPHLPQRYPMSLKFYDLLFSGQLGYELVEDFTAYPSLLGIQVPDQTADESFWVYDHPRVLIYKKVRDLSDQEWSQALGGTWEKAVYGYTGQRPQDRGEPSNPATGEAAAGPTLLLDQPVNTLPDVGRIAWNPFRYNSVLSLLMWWVVLILLNALSWPIAFAVFRNLRDRGWGLSRALGLILLAWLSWMLPALHILVNSLLPVLVALVLVALLSVWLWRRNRAEMRAFGAENRGLIWFSEILFSGAFLFFVFIRLLNPDLWHPWQGGEKLMEFAFLNAVTRTPYFPAYDPYFAGGYLNYYYYGYQILALLIKVTGITPTIAFNLAIPTLYGLTVGGVFSLVYSLAPSRRHERVTSPGVASAPSGPGGRSLTLPVRMVGWRRGVPAGLVGVLFVAMLGNLEGGLLTLRTLAERSGSQFVSNLPLVQGVVRTAAGLAAVVGGRADLPGYDWWAPSRVFPFTINEFPFWSFLFADLHPHLIGIPFTVLFLGLAYNLVAGGRSKEASGRGVGFLALAAMPLTLGAIGAINTWDLPTYLGVGFVAWLVREWRAEGRVRILRTLLFVGALAGLSYLLYLPFYRNYTTVFDTGVALSYAKTSLGAWLRIWGLFLFLVIGYVLLELRRAPGDVPVLRWLSDLIAYRDRAPRFLDRVQQLVRSSTALRLGQVVLGVAFLLALLFVLLGYTVIALLLLLVTLTALYLFRRTSPAPAQFRAILFFTALLVLLGVEIVYLKDFLSGAGDGGFFSRQHGDYYRMNTLFKFYIQVWVMLGIAAAASLPALLDEVETWRRGWRGAWWGGFGVLLALSLVFPILGTAQRVDDRFPDPRPARNTLDGMAFMTVGRYTWPDASNTIELEYDHEAIRWLQENVTGTPVLAEAPASWYPVNGQNAGYDYYRAGGLRASSLTGLPTFLGQHQGEQRYGSQTGPRETQGREFWETTDRNRLRELIRDLHVNYIYVGQLEHILFSPEQLAKFDALVDAGEAEVAFQNDNVTIYRVLDQAPNEAASGN